VFAKALFATASRIAIAFLLVITTTRADAAKQRVYVGTYSNGKSEGVYLCEFDPTTGSLQTKGVAAAYHTQGEQPFKNASFLALYPKRPLLYAVSEDQGGAVVGFHIDPSDGALKRFTTESTEGSGPCHLIVDGQGANVLAANYGSGNVCVLPIDPEQSELKPASTVIQNKGSGPNKDRQAGPHAHQIILDAANRFAFVCDLGTDKVMIYRYNAAAGKLTPNDPPSVSVAAGAGPRHMVFDPSGRYAYVINELDSTITAFRYDAKLGLLKELQAISTLPEDFKGENTTAEIAVHPSGKFLYGSNRGHDSITIFAIDAASGQLKPLGHEPTGGHTPRHFTLDPTGKFLLAANQDSNNITVHRLDPTTGRLSPLNKEAAVPAPVCVLFAP
jgi:6-phosphogluconolactonase